MNRIPNEEFLILVYQHIGSQCGAMPWTLITKEWLELTDYNETEEKEAKKSALPVRIRNKWVRIQSKICKIYNYSLPNWKQSCYINSGVHQLVTFPIFASFISQFKISTYDDKTKDIFGFQLLDILNQLKCAMKVKPDESRKDKDEKCKVKKHCIRYLVNNVNKLNETLIPKQQNGCMDFIDSVLNILQSVGIRELSEMIKNLFNTKYLVFKKCMECEYVESQPNTSKSIGVSMRTNDESTTECIYTYCSTDLLTGDNKVYCNQCKKKTITMNWIQFTKIAKILIINYNQYGGIRKHLALEETLNFNTFPLNKTMINHSSNINNNNNNNDTILHLYGTVIYDAFSSTIKNSNGHYRSFHFCEELKSFIYTNDDKPFGIAPKKSVLSLSPFIAIYISSDLLNYYRSGQQIGNNHNNHNNHNDNGFDIIDIYAEDQVSSEDDENDILEDEEDEYDIKRIKKMLIERDWDLNQINEAIKIFNQQNGALENSMKMTVENVENVLDFQLDSLMQIDNDSCSEDIDDIDDIGDIDELSEYLPSDVDINCDDENISKKTTKKPSKNNKKIEDRIIELQSMLLLIKDDAQKMKYIEENYKGPEITQFVNYLYHLRLMANKTFQKLQIYCNPKGGKKNKIHNLVKYYKL